MLNELSELDEMTQERKEQMLQDMRACVVELYDAMGIIDETHEMEVAVYKLDRLFCRALDLDLREHALPNPDNRPST